MKQQQRAMMVDAAAVVRTRPVAVAKRRVLSVRGALEWAFAVENVSLDLDNLPEWHVGTDTIWRLMRQHELGCRVDGGGRSDAHHDAEIIASFVAALPIEHGGKRMAVQVAELARAGRMPDALVDARLRCVPVHLSQGNQYGPRAKAEDVPGDASGRWARPVGKGRPASAPQWCRVTYTPTSAQIGAARRNWLEWWGALLHLGQQLRDAGGLESVIVSQDMPPLDPWNKRG